MNKHVLTLILSSILLISTQLFSMAPEKHPILRRSESSAFKTACEAQLEILGKTNVTEAFCQALVAPIGNTFATAGTYCFSVGETPIASLFNTIKVGVATTLTLNDFWDSIFHPWFLQSIQDLSSQVKGNKAMLKIIYRLLVLWTRGGLTTTTPHSSRKPREYILINSLSLRLQYYGFSPHDAEMYQVWFERKIYASFFSEKEPTN